MRVSAFVVSCRSPAVVISVDFGLDQIGAVDREQGLAFLHVVADLGEQADDPPLIRREHLGRHVLIEIDRADRLRLGSGNRDIRPAATLNDCSCVSDSSTVSVAADGIGVGAILLRRGRLVSRSQAQIAGARSARFGGPSTLMATATRDDRDCSAQHVPDRRMPGRNPRSHRKHLFPRGNKDRGSAASPVYCDKSQGAPGFVTVPRRNAGP